MKGHLVAFKLSMAAKSLSAALPLRSCQATSSWGWWGTNAVGEFASPAGKEGRQGGQLWPTPLVTPGAPTHTQTRASGQCGGGTSAKLLLLSLSFPQPSDRWDD